jgi:GAF domain-containing protein
MTLESADPRQNVEEHVRLEKLLAGLFSRFINLPPGEVDREILEAQRLVCECLDFDLSALWQWAPDGPPALTMTHVYRPLEGPPIPEAMDGRQHFPWCLHEITAGRSVVLADVEKAPPEAARDLEGWRHFGLKSVHTLPLLAVGGAAIGALNFNTIREQRDWPDALVQRLRLVAHVFSNALVQARLDQALEDRLRFETLISDLSARMVAASSSEVDQEIERALEPRSAP